ncbi:cAMP-dependent protein kinase inhibitor gamma [Engraulis encrasicolus]|uniref:cAMP-dependent protein kinase inhibitor gamma n=1 Tax=Engraulis encrasicolus TaxID=184585 RepID=UPI002FD5E492
MMDVEASYSEFITGDRTGRRNAVPDITEEAQAVGTVDLTKDMAQMDLKTTEGEAGASPAPEAAEASSSQGAQGREGPS